jgi:hypothetical protein
MIIIIIILFGEILSKINKNPNVNFKMLIVRPIFTPRDVDEEILLLLLLGQTSTLNEAVLDWQPEYEAQRERSHQAAYNILALLSIFLSRKQAFHIIADVSFSF